MLEVLESGIIYEEQQIESHLSPQTVNRVVEGMEEAVVGLMRFVRKRSSKIQQEIKDNAHSQRAGDSEWAKIEDTLTTAREEILEMKDMVEVYSGYTLRNGMDSEEKEFENV